MRHRSAVPARSAIAVVAAALAVASSSTTTASAGTVSVEGGVARFVDGSGVDDLIHLGVGSDDSGAAWFFTTDVADPRPVAGAGCQLTLGLGECAFGGAPPASVLVDVAGGNDDVRYTSTVRAPTRVRIAGGPGNDTLRAYETRGELDGGDGDDTLRPDDHYSVSQLPPGPTPGGTVRGGAGTDTVEYDATAERFAISLDGRANDGRGGEGDNVLPDVENVTGGDEGNVISGSDAANVLQGGGGEDRLTGGRGRDTLAGRGGNDTLDALDGAGGDRLDCSDGADVAYADAGDVLAAGTCERVTWAPAVAAGRLRHADGAIPVPLACPATSAAACRGTVLLRSAGRSPATLASGSYAVRRGARASILLTPTRAGRAALRSGRTVAAEAVVRPRGTQPSAGRSVTIRG
ncbi:calcium-binding protein [Conexibacter woesei]|uniref:Hemolysin-type calcium-binding region n=1 Tax=Conexibacter woesei (strain DSM 14684 / CCUG 47730 / CIP 108061 / JCM 11494 / NBRC 100937 / ID131577) TaxID=469383 RepID=D3FCX4_CONWI|nr:calcium-binding protein [Conexibacter woesei]ADB51486.1 hypothetical protein Cwoe_3067 [Conexibacter woesei DSM 14684]